MNGVIDLLELLHQTAVVFWKMSADIHGASKKTYHNENCIYFCPHVPGKCYEILLGYTVDKYQRL